MATTLRPLVALACGEALRRVQQEIAPEEHEHAHQEPPGSSVGHTQDPSIAERLCCEDARNIEAHYQTTLRYMTLKSPAQPRWLASK